MLDVPFTDEEAERARQRYEDARDRCGTAGDSPTPADLARRAEACVDAGTFALAFERDGARTAHDAFADAAGGYLDSAESRLADPAGTDYAAVPMHHWRGAYAALLAGDRERCRALADSMAMVERAPEPGVELDPQPYHFARAVTATAAGDDPTAREALEDVRTGNPWTEATTRVMQGALDGDREAVRAGLDGLVDRHAERVEKRGDGGPRRDLAGLVFSAEATALTLSAWERGLEVDPESRYVPSAFCWETLPKLQA